MHLYPLRRDVAAQVAGEFKTVTYATPFLGRNAERKERKKKLATRVGPVFFSFLDVTLTVKTLILRLDRLVVLFRFCFVLFCFVMLHVKWL